MVGCNCHRAMAGKQSTYQVDDDDDDSFFFILTTVFLVICNVCNVSIC